MWHQMDQQAIEQQTRLIVSQYEALIARPSVFEEDEANPSFYTPETSLCRDSNNSSRLPPEHVSQLLHMQSQRDSLDEEIHSLHLAYLSLQSTGDANERTLRESKV